MTTELSEVQINFTKVAIACIEYFKMPLIDILQKYIKPEKLCGEINKCDPLMFGDYALDSEQLKKCQCVPADYFIFDVTLLYRLIRNIPVCANLKKDKILWCEIEKIRLMKNDLLSHPFEAKFDNTEFQNTWAKIEGVFEKIQRLMTKRGIHHSDNLQKLKTLRDCRVGLEEYRDTLRGKFAFH